MTDTRKRKRFDFWLDIDDEGDFALWGLIKSLKKQRLFTKTIRDGIRLITALRDGNIQVLFELFPSIHDILYAQMEADVMERLGVQKDTEVIQHIIELKGVISQFKNQPMLSAPVEGTVTMRRVMQHEEIELEVKQASGGNGQSAQNFLSSMMALQGERPKPQGVKQLDAPQLDIPSYDDDEDMDFFKTIAQGD